MQLKLTTVPSVAAALHVLFCVWSAVSQQQLQPNTAAALKAAVPDLEEEDFEAMMRAPMRSFEPNQMQVWLV
jgi:hypothetical protein